MYWGDTYELFGDLHRAVSDWRTDRDCD